jgi:hypothetical protein
LRFGVKFAPMRPYLCWLNQRNLAATSEKLVLPC